MSRMRPWHSMAFRLALYYGGLLVLTMVVVLAIFYVQMVAVFGARMEHQAHVDLKRLITHAQQFGEASLQHEIRNLLTDGVDSQTEIAILTAPNGEMLVGNATILPKRKLNTLGLRELRVLRQGHEVIAKVAVERLESGNLLIVGSDMEPLHDIEQRFVRASLLAVALVLALALMGSIGFRKLVDERAADIRRTMLQVSTGDLRQRIVLPPHEDEFTRLGSDINKMLDQVEHLMEGVRHVSNTIAHNLRTPLTRVLLQLRTARHMTGAEQHRVLEHLENEVQDLGNVFEKLLQIAELESGMRRQEFSAVDLGALLLDIEDLYGPVIEDREGVLEVDVQGQPAAFGDADLLASALANLVENAIKYACDQPGGRVHLHASVDGEQVVLRLHDNGAGVPPERLPQLTERFYRAHDRQPGHGLGLSSVQAIVQLHDGSLHMANLAPGFEVTLHLPAAPMALSSTRQ